MTKKTSNQSERERYEVNFYSSMNKSYIVWDKDANRRLERDEVVKLLNTRPMHNDKSDNPLHETSEDVTMPEHDLTVAKNFVDKALEGTRYENSQETGKHDTTVKTGALDAQDAEIDGLLKKYRELIAEELEYHRGGYDERYDMAQSDINNCVTEIKSLFQRKDEEIKNWEKLANEAEERSLKTREHIKQLEKELAEAREEIGRWKYACADWELNANSKIETIDELKAYIDKYEKEINDLKQQIASAEGKLENIFESPSHVENVVDEETGKQKWTIHCGDGTTEDLQDEYGAFGLMPETFPVGTIVKTCEPLPAPPADSGITNEPSNTDSCAKEGEG